MDFLFNLLFSIITGVLNGLYVGIILYKYSLFAMNKERVFEILNRFEFIGNGKYSEVRYPDRLNSDIGKLVHLAMNFSSSHHIEAYENTMLIRSKLCDALSESSAKKLSSERVSVINDECYKLYNSLFSSKRILIRVISYKKIHAYLIGLRKTNKDGE